MRAVRRKIREAHALGLTFSTAAFTTSTWGQRIKGFHTATGTRFPPRKMFALIMLAAFLLFARAAAKLDLAQGRVRVSDCALAVLLAETRGVWFATAAAGFYLLWVWKRKLLLLAPVAIVLAVGGVPARHPGRFQSILQPKEVDSKPVPHRRLAHRPPHD